MPVAVATSRRKVLEKSLGQDHHQPAVRPQRGVFRRSDLRARDADEAEMEAKRRELTAALNALTDKAPIAMVDGPMSERWARADADGPTAGRARRLSVVSAAMSPGAPARARKTRKRRRERYGIASRHRPAGR
jgi:hypothetical protein